MDRESSLPVRRSWTADKEKEWASLAEQKNNAEIYAFFNEIIRDAFFLDDPVMIRERLAFLDCCRRRLSEFDSSLLSRPELASLGHDAYRGGELPTAEIAFRMLSEGRDSVGRNNYAYMMRRGEVSDPLTNSPLKALALFREGIKEAEPFSFVNAALAFALCFGSEEDWSIADELMKRLPETDTSSIQAWWGEVARNGDIEGILVHYLLVRHGKVGKSELGSKEAMSAKLTAALPGFPDYLKTAPRFQSLSDVFGIFLSEDFEESLAAFLDSMPRERASAEEILRETGQWDEWQLYRALLQDFRTFLTKEELSRVIASYKKKFTVPLPSVTDLDIEVETGTVQGGST